MTVETQNEEGGGGKIELDVSRRGLKLRFTKAPKVAYILLAIFIGFFLVLIGHAILNRSLRADKIEALAAKLKSGKPLTDKDAEMLNTMSPEELDKLKTYGDTEEDKHWGKRILEIDGMRMEQCLAPGTKTTITRDGKTTSITKGGD